jgi:thymidylate synthase (FAD)
MKIELIGGCTKEELESRIQYVAGAGKLSRFPGNVTEVLESCNDYESNLKLIKRIIKMGHKSIIEHDFLVFALNDVTPIVEQTLIGYRLTSFTVKSRREVDFRTAGFYTPEFRNKSGEIHEKNEELKEEYNKHIKMLFNTYGDIVDNGVSKEDARFILPYAYHSNFIMGVNGRELERMIIALRNGKLSNIPDLKEVGDELYKIVKDHVPYLVPNLKKQENNLETGFEYLESMEKRPEIEILEKTNMISYTPNSDDVVLESAIMYHYQCSREKAKEILTNMVKKDEKAKEKMMYEIMHKEERRELEQVTFTFQIPISLAVLTHLTRHRMHSLLIPEFLPMWDLKNYITPISIQENANDIYQEAVRKNIEIVEKFRLLGVNEGDLVYFYLSNQMVNVITTMNARNIQWVTRLRCCNKAQWQIRFIANDIRRQVSEVAPLIGKGLGATCMTDRYCGEGRESCGLIDKILMTN